MNMAIEGRQGQGLGPVEIPYRTAHGIDLSVEDARLFGKALQTMAVRNLYIAIDCGLFPHTAIVDHNAGRDLQGRVVLRLGDEFGLLAERFPAVQDQAEDEIVTVGLTYYDIEALNRAVWNGSNEAGRTKLNDWPEGERDKQKKGFTALWRLMGKFVAAGGPDNPAWRKRNETVLTEERVWGAVPDETTLTHA